MSNKVKFKILMQHESLDGSHLFEISITCMVYNLHVFNISFASMTGQRYPQLKINE